MIDYKLVTIDDKNWIRDCISFKKNTACEYSFGNIFSYSAKYEIYVAKVEDTFVSRIDCGDIVVYSFPVGKGDIRKALQQVLTQIERNNEHAEIYGMNKEEAKLFNQICAEKYEAKLVRDSFDYCYYSTDLINLSGKKYQPKRNHISFFVKNNNWTYERISAENIADCYQMSREWLEKYTGDNKADLESELKIIKKAFDNYSVLDYVGGLIRVDGKVVAYSMGEKLDETHFCVHFEKAFSEIRGAYPIINREFVKNELSGYQFINREDDIGLENLRKAKLSYNPAYFEEKYEAVIN